MSDFKVGDLVRIKDSPEELRSRADPSLINEFGLVVYVGGGGCSVFVSGNTWGFLFECLEKVEINDG